MINTFYAGAGKAEYTPSKDMLPVKLFFSPGNNNPFTGIHDPTYARAIMISDGTNRAVLISVEMPSPPDTDKWLYYEISPAISKVAKNFNLREDQVFLVATHSHAVPGVGDVPPEASDEAKNFDQMYSKMVYQAILDAVKEAEATMRPARIGVSKGVSAINCNRYKLHTSQGSGETSLVEGFDSSRPVDQTLFTLRIEDYDQNAIAFYVNYPVHGIIMMGNTLIDGGCAISADIAGNASGLLERSFPGSVAIWSPAPCADQVPIMFAHGSYLDPSTKEEVHFDMDECQKLLLSLGSRHFEDILQTLNKVHCIDRNTQIQTAVDWSVTPGQTPIFNEPGHPWSGVKEIKKEEAPDVRVRMQLLRIGDIALVGTSGELDISFGKNIRDASPLKDTCVAELCGSRIPGYVHDDDNLNSGMISNIQTGYLAESFAKVTQKLFAEAL